jgi:hypothetical protein
MIMKNLNYFTLVMWDLSNPINSDKKTKYEIIKNYYDKRDTYYYYDKNNYNRSLCTIIDHYESLDDAIADKDFYSESEEEEEALHAQFIKYVL